MVPIISRETSKLQSAIKNQPHAFSSLDILEWSPLIVLSIYANHIKIESVDIKI